MPRGGTREGAGRPKKADKHARPIAQAEKKFADKLPTIADTILELAEGGQQITTEVFELALLLTVDDISNEEVGEKTVSMKIKRQLFPKAGADELVLIRRTVQTLPPDLKANIYAADRIMGKPTERLEASGPDGGAIPVSVEHAIERIYGAKNDPTPSQDE